MSKPELRPRVGVGLLAIKDGKILLGKRKNAHGDGEYAGTGGHLENSESMENAVHRELREECGVDIRIKNLKFLCVSNIKRYLPKHYIDVGFVAEWESGEAQVMEPEKIESWNWYDIENLPQPLFEVEEIYIKAYKTGQHYFDS